MPPFKLRKAPRTKWGDDAFWVVDATGKHFSKDPMPKAQARQQQKALYAAEGRRGGGGATHRDSVLEKYKLADRSYSLPELAKLTKVPEAILQEVYNRGVGAYKTQPRSVRLQHSFVKNVDAPMSAKLSKEQWGYARVYSFLDGNPAHDNDLRRNRGGGPLETATGLLEDAAQNLMVVLDDEGNLTAEELAELRKNLREKGKKLRRGETPINEHVLVALAHVILEESPTPERLLQLAKEAIAALKAEIDRIGEIREPKELTAYSREPPEQHYRNILNMIFSVEPTSPTGELEELKVAILARYDRMLAAYGPPPTTIKEVLDAIRVTPAVPMAKDPKFFSLLIQLTKLLPPEIARLEGKPFKGGAHVVGGAWYDVFTKGAEKVRDIGKKVVQRVRDVSKGVRKGYPPHARQAIADYGEYQIVSLTLRRDPIQSFINTALNVISLGQWEKARASLPYDKLFHLGLVVGLKGATGRVVHLTVEKNEVITIKPTKPRVADTEMLNLSPPRPPIRFADFLKKAEETKPDYFTYDAFTNNCQDFVLHLLKANGLSSDAATQFIKQDVSALLKELPGYVAPVARAVTDLGAVANVALEGEGQNGFMMQLKRLEISPTAYLRAARAAAKKAGYNPRSVSFAEDGVHKLQIKTDDGRVERFGRVKYGDFIIYRILERRGTIPKGTSTTKRNRFRASHKAIRGEWRKDRFSPNSLALAILW